MRGRVELPIRQTETDAGRRLPERPPANWSNVGYFPPDTFPPKIAIVVVNMKNSATAENENSRDCEKCSVSAPKTKPMFGLSLSSRSFRGDATVPADFGVLLRRRWSYRPHDAPRWVVEPSRRLLLERGMLSHRLLVLRHRCCSSAVTSRRHCFSQRTLHHSVRLRDRL